MNVIEHEGIKRDEAIVNHPLPGDDSSQAEDVTRCNTTHSLPASNVTFMDHQPDNCDEFCDDSDERPPTKRRKTTEPIADNQETQDQPSEEEKVEADEADRTRILHKIERLIISGCIGHNDLNALKESKDIVKMLKDLHQLSTLELKVMDGLLRTRLMKDSPVGNPVTLVQSLLGNVLAKALSNKEAAKIVVDDRALTVSLDELVGDYVDSLPALVKVGASLFRDVLASFECDVNSQPVADERKTDQSRVGDDKPASPTDKTIAFRSVEERKNDANSKTDH